MFPFNSQKGFTLIELLTSIAIIGVLAAVAIQQYSLYKIRGYDAHSKQALHDINLLCNAYWTENYISDECDLAKSKEYGFIEHSDVVATLPSSPLDTFCASAKHNSSPNTYSIDSASLISSGENCGGAGGSAQTASASSTDPEAFANYKPPENACDRDGSWIVVDSNGKQVKGQGSMVCTCGFCGPGGGIYEWGGPSFGGTAPWGKGTLADNGYKAVFENPGHPITGNVTGRGGNYQHSGDPKDQLTYNFSTNIWTTGSGEKYDTNGNRVN